MKHLEFCPVCGMVNLDDKPKCFACGESLEKKPRPPKAKEPERQAPAKKQR